MTKAELLDGPTVIDQGAKTLKNISRQAVGCLPGDSSALGFAGGTGAGGGKLPLRHAFHYRGTTPPDGLKFPLATPKTDSLPANQDEDRMYEKFILPAALLLTVGGAASLAAPPVPLTPQERLGEAIFFDKQLSVHNNQSCADCHAERVGWTGPEPDSNRHGAVYEGSIRNRFGNRKPPSSGYATLSPLFYFDAEEGLFVGGNFWDGRATGWKLGNPAADQAQGPFLNPVEQALPDAACVVYRVCTSAKYGALFTEVWGAETCRIAWPSKQAMKKTCSGENVQVPLSEPDRAKVDTAYDDIALAIAAYEDSPAVNQFSSKYDAYLAGQVQLTPQEAAGLKLFEDKAQCAACHVLDPAGPNGKPLVTDFTYDNLGVPKNPENPWYTMPPKFNPEGYAWVDEGLAGFLKTVPEYAAYVEESRGKHKVPSLRNADKRPGQGFVKAYGHNGWFKSLESIVHFYNTRDVLAPCPPRPDALPPNTYTEAEARALHCWPEPEIAANVNTDELGNLGLSPEEEAAIVAFLKTLSDGYVPPKGNGKP
jgi:cytochrome c peroxidase